MGGAAVMSQTRGALQGCIFAGLIYAAVETLPVAILGSDLPCGGCGTEEWFPPPGSLFFLLLKSWLVFATRGLAFHVISQEKTTSDILSPCVCLLAAHCFV